MAKHFHLVLDFEDGEIIGIALPVEAAGAVGSGPRKTTTLTGTINGVNRVFTFPEPVIHQVSPGVQVYAYHGGRRLTELDFVIEESVPSSGDFDTLRLLRFAPSRNQLLVDYVPA